MEGEACIPNIGPAERRKRSISGVVLMVIGLALAGGLWAGGTELWLRAIAFLPFFGGATGFFQAREKT
jgi:hypothetical protein